MFCSKDNFVSRVSGLRSATAKYAGHGAATSCHDDGHKQCVPAADASDCLLTTDSAAADAAVHSWPATGVELHCWSWWPGADAGEICVIVNKSGFFLLMVYPDDFKTHVCSCGAKLM